MRLKSKLHATCVGFSHCWNCYIWASSGEWRVPSGQGQVQLLGLNGRGGLRYTRCAAHGLLHSHWGLSMSGLVSCYSLLCSVLLRSDDSAVLDMDSEANAAGKAAHVLEKYALEVLFHFGVCECVYISLRVWVCVCAGPVQVELFIRLMVSAQTATKSKESTQNILKNRYVE